MIGKTEYPCREWTWASYYLRKKGDSGNKKLLTLGGFSLFNNQVKEEKERRLKLKIIHFAKKQPHVRFLTKIPLWGEERVWDINKEIEFSQYLDSPLAEEERRDYERQAPRIFLIFCGVVGLLLLAILMFSKLNL